MNKIVIIVQARMASTRLPGKILMPILGKPLIYRMVERLQRCKFIDSIVIATTDNAKDDMVEEVCSLYGWNCFRGDEQDLLDRHYQAAIENNADIVLKIPSDCPLIDPEIVDNIVSFFVSGDFDYVSNLHPASYPDGNDVEVMSFAALAKSWGAATKSFEREHTTPYIWENPDKFVIGNYLWETGLNYSMSHRFTIDYYEDYEFISRVYEELYPLNPKFGLDDIINLLNSRNEILDINKIYAGVNWYRHHLDELNTIDHSQTKIFP